MPLEDQRKLLGNDPVGLEPDALGDGEEEGEEDGDELEL